MKLANGCSKADPVRPIVGLWKLAALQGQTRSPFQCGDDDCLHADFTTDVSLRPQRRTRDNFAPSMPAIRLAQSITASFVLNIKRAADALHGVS
jgi:hypothetical protein